MMLAQNPANHDGRESENNEFQCSARRNRGILRFRQKMKTARSSQFRDRVLPWLLHLTLLAAALAVAIWAEGKLSG
ncbi:MAG: hypothetical protein ACOY32_11145 [Thermodesulfobacteriota bacterium]